MLILFAMKHCELLLTNLHLATMAGDAYGECPDGEVAIRDGKILWLGPAANRPELEAAEVLDCDGCWLTPALIDCHTHLVFAGDRSGEYAARLQGKSYEDIAREGGGILSTVRATRAASEETLIQQSAPRLDRLMRSGVATVEIKSGYGLETDTELRMLAAARKLGESFGATVVTSLLAAHTIPPEYKNDVDAYIDLVCDEMIPACDADAVDAYCESIAFNAEQVARVFAAAKKAGLPVRLHADQLSDGAGAALAANFAALSADHLEYTNVDGVAAMAAANTVAVLLPGAYLTLQETQAPPVSALRKSGVPMAVATDCNPGTSPLTSMTAAMSLGSRLFGLSPVECLRGATCNAAKALGLDDRGVLAAGKRADLALWDIGHPDQLAYWMGSDEPSSLWIAGRQAF